MREALSATLADHYEVAVIGGGVNGAGIAQALAAAGYGVALLERHDFGSGTTSRSTRLVHGGLRYLEHGEFGLVYESLQERAALLRLFPHLVKPIQLLLPLYEGGAYPAWKARAGLTLYDLLALGRGLMRHQSLGRQHALSREPTLQPDGLKAALLFSDAQVDLAERLAVECALAARSLGANVANYAEIREIRPQSNHRLSLTIYDRLSHETLEVSADVAINATGPWVDGLLRKSGANTGPLIGGTRGSHLAIPADRLAVGGAIYAPARSDGRPFFVLPWLGMFLVGTTDIRHEGDPDDAFATPQEIEYLLSEMNSLLGADVSVGDVLYTYSGVRPLPYEKGASEGAITRRHFLVDHSEDGIPGLYSLVGGKLTTFRSVGRRVVKMMKRRLGERWPQTDGFAPSYGQPSSSEPCADLDEPVCEHSPEPKSAVIAAVRNELATSVADVLLRRTTVGWRICRGEHAAGTVAALIGAELGWDDQRQSLEIARFLEEAESVRPVASQAESSTSAPAP